MSKENIAGINQLYRSFRRKLLGGGISVTQRNRIRGNRALLGETRFETDEIIIKRSLPEQLKLQTLVHELLHTHYPNASEETVERATPEVYGKLSQRRRDFLSCFLLEDTQK